MILLQLFYEFFITGLFIFGGGLAVIPFLQQMSERTGWFTTVELMDIIAIAEATPGPIGVNMATYVGYTVSGIPGGIIASAGLLLPSVIIALIIARLLSRFRENEIVKSALYGLRPASLGLITSAGVTVFCLAVFGIHFQGITLEHFTQFDWRILVLAVALFIATNRLKAHPIIYLAVSAAVGIFVF
jgi:chromate transporter